MTSMTKDKLEEIMNTLPDNMSEGELCALTLTIYSTYIKDTASIISELVATIYTFASSRGISDELIGIGLRMSADGFDKKKKH